MSSEVLLGIFLDHLPSILTAFGMVVLWVRSIATRKLVKEGVAVSSRNGVAIEGVRYDLQNGVGKKIAEMAVEHMKPALEEAATVASDKVKSVADEVATKLVAAAWDGVERRVGLPDRRVKTVEENST